MKVLLSRCLLLVLLILPMSASGQKEEVTSEMALPADPAPAPPEDPLPASDPVPENELPPPAPVPPEAPPAEPLEVAQELPAPVEAPLRRRTLALPPGLDRSWFVSRGIEIVGDSEGPEMRLIIFDPLQGGAASTPLQERGLGAALAAFSQAPGWVWAWTPRFWRDHLDPAQVSVLTPPEVLFWQSRPSPDPQRDRDQGLGALSRFRFELKPDFRTEAWPGTAEWRRALSQGRLDGIYEAWTGPASFKDASFRSPGVPSGPGLALVWVASDSGSSGPWSDLLTAWAADPEHWQFWARQGFAPARQGAFANRSLWFNQLPDVLRREVFWNGGASPGLWRSRWLDTLRDWRRGRWKTPEEAWLWYSR